MLESLCDDLSTDECAGSTHAPWLRHKDPVRVRIDPRQTDPLPFPFAEVNWANASLMAVSIESKDDDRTDDGSPPGGAAATAGSTGIGTPVSACGMLLLIN